MGTFGVSFFFFLFFLRISIAKGQPPSRIDCGQGWTCLAMFLNLSPSLPQMATYKMDWGFPAQSQGGVGGHQLLCSLKVGSGCVFGELGELIGVWAPSCLSWRGEQCVIVSPKPQGRP